LKNRPNSSTRRVSAKLALLAGCLLACGCGDSDRPDLGRVSGRVTLDGQPLPGATVTFTPLQGGRASLDRTDANGDYELLYLRDIRGAIVGRHNVSITTAGEENPEERLPDRYNRESELTEDVQGGSNTFNYELTSE